MFIFLLILIIAVFLLILATGALKPPRSSLSLFELKRRKAADDKRVEIGLQRELYFCDVLAIRDFVLDLLFLALFALLIIVFKWWPGIGLCILAILVYRLSFNTTFLTRLVHKLYLRIEGPLLVFVAKNRMISKLLGFRHYSDNRESKINSSFELMHLINDAGPSVLTDNDKQLILGGMNLKKCLVSEIMTRRKDIVCVKKTELLGPLVLDDLHSSGHRQIPVISGSIDHVVGILTLDSFLNLDQKRSVTAGSAFDQPVYSIGDDKNLEEALIEFLKTGSRLLIVNNFDRHTVGLITLDDVMKSLFGRDLRR